MAVVTGHTCNGGGFSGSRPIEQRKAECPACQRSEARKTQDGIERARHLAHCFYISRAREICVEENVPAASITEGFRLADIDRRVRAEQRSYYGDPAYGAWPERAAVERDKRFKELDEADRERRSEEAPNADYKGEEWF